MPMFDPKFYEIIQRLESKIDELQSTVDTIRRRQSTYIGSGAALTYLFDDSPFYVNSYDFGPPSNYLNGGKYEQDNLEVILSFIKDDSIFLDIGANLGFYSIIIGRRVRPSGKIYAFEPNKKVSKLFKATAYLNSLSSFDGTDGTITIHEIALGNTNENIQLLIPDHHAGGARVATDFNKSDNNYLTSSMVKLDNFMPEGFRCDVVKIDVEGYELNVLLGMEKIINNSPNIKIIFENYGQNIDRTKNIFHFIKNQNLYLYTINHGPILKSISLDQMHTYQGYLLASKINLDLTTDTFKFFTIYPKQFWGANHIFSQGNLVSKGNRGSLLFHGPYWYLESGYYEISIDGMIDGNVELTMCSNFGYVVAVEFISGKNPIFKKIIPKDLIYFECAARVVSDQAEVSIASITFRKLA